METILSSISLECRFAQTTSYSKSDANSSIPEFRTLMLTEFLSAFSIDLSYAALSTSIAVTLSAPSFAARIARTPLPDPISRNDFT